MIDYPKMRPVQAFPVEMNGQNMIALRDRKSDSPEVVVVTPHLFFIISLFTGQNSIRDIQYLYTKQFGTLINSAQIEDIVRQIDEKLLLDSPRYQQHLQQMKAEYLALPARPAMFQAKSYPADPTEIDLLFNTFVTGPKGPGPLDPTRRKAIPRALVAPHIDFHRGGPCYAHAYKVLAEAEDIDLFIILGTDHDQTSQFFSVSSKDYDTPFGPARRNCEVIDRLAGSVDFDLFADEFNHRQEHSIEFQVVMLKWLYQSRPDFTIVPILCGSLHEFIEEEEKPMDNPQFRSFVESLKKTLADYPGKACLIAAVDFSHVGVQFGAQAGPTPGEVDTIVSMDRRLIDAITASDAGRFFAELQDSRNINNVCGVTPLYTMLETIPNCRGSLLNYDYWHDEQEGSLVSFASIVLNPSPVA